MGRSTTTTRKDAQALFHSLRSAYAATPTSLKIIDLYVIFVETVSTALIQDNAIAAVDGKRVRPGGSPGSPSGESRKKQKNVKTAPPATAS